MNSDSDVDMSWIELAAGGDNSLKRAMSSTSTGQTIEAKRSRIVPGGVSEGVQTEGETESMLDGSRAAALDHDLKMDSDEMEGVEVAKEKKEDVGKEEKEVGRSGPEPAEVKKERERIRVGRQKERDEKTAFWTTPGLRPLFEPPILDWDWFFRVWIPSDLRYKALFPNDPEKRCRMKDIDGERGVLAEYRHCAAMASDDPETDSERQEFYDNLHDEICKDWNEVAREYDDIWAMATDLARFEFVRLDNDGRTTQLQHWIGQGADVFRDWGDEVREKYSYLVPQGFAENPLVTFKFF